MTNYFWQDGGILFFVKGVRHFEKTPANMTGFEHLNQLKKRYA